MTLRRLATLVAGIVMVLGLFTVVGVLPMSTYTKQRRETLAIDQRLNGVRADNDQLRSEIRRLQSDGEVQRLAREQFGMVLPGQEVYAIPSLRVDAQVGNTARPPTKARVRRSGFWGRVLFWR